MPAPALHLKPPHPQPDSSVDGLDGKRNNNPDDAKTRFHKLLSNLAKEYDMIVDQLVVERDFLEQSGASSGVLAPDSSPFKQGTPVITPMVRPGRMPGSIANDGNAETVLDRYGHGHGHGHGQGILVTTTPVELSERSCSKQIAPGRHLWETKWSKQISPVMAPCMASPDIGITKQSSPGRSVCDTFSRLTSPISVGSTVQPQNAIDILSSSLPSGPRQNSPNQSSVQRSHKISASGDKVLDQARASKRQVIASKLCAASFPELEDCSKPDRASGVSSVIDIGVVESETTEAHCDMLRSSFRSDCMLSPIGKPRLCWDILWCVSLIYDMWWSMFILVFSSEPDDKLRVFQVLSAFTMYFWFCDIILNFFTGFVIDGRHIVLEHRLVAWRYARTWLCFDVVATFPFDIFLGDQIGSGALSSIRIAKATKAVKMLKALKLIRAVKLLQMRNRNKYLTASYWLSTKGSAASAALLFLFPFFVVFAHFHGCLWASANLDWQPTADSVVAVRKYFESFSWAYTAITFGTEVRSTHAPQAIVEALLCTERVMLVGCLGSYVVFKTMAYFDQHAQVYIRHDEMTSYLKDHDVDAKTQIEVICTLHETAHAMKRQQNFQAVVDELPLELRRNICTELWSSNLLTLELFEVLTVWHGDVVTEIAQFVKEEVHATKAILCREGETAISAYHLIKGRIQATSTHREAEIPIYVPGNWIGEQSLAFPGFTRTSTATCLLYTIVLMVPADDFQRLLEKLELQENFRNFVDNEMGSLCGRCGRICDHHPDECETISALSRPSACNSEAP